MAAAAACKRVSQIGTNSSINLTRYRGFGGPPYRSPQYEPSAVQSASFRRKFDCRRISQCASSNQSRLFLVDTLALVRKLEAQGVPSKQAEAITAAMTDVLHVCLETVSRSVISKAVMEKSEVIYESNLSKFKTKVQSSQAHHFSALQHETEKLRNDIEKMCSDLRHEIDKVRAGQRLDFNLERGRIRDELANQNSDTSHLTNKLDQEIHASRTQLEAGKYDVIKNCIGSLVSISAVGLAVVRILM